MGNKNYDTILPGRDRGSFNFHTWKYKKDAISYALELTGHGRFAYVKNRRTGQITYILHRSRTSCRVCGNELEGKKHCPLCGTLHYYA
jgi:rubrerythrin